MLRRHWRAPAIFQPLWQSRGAVTPGMVCFDPLCPPDDLALGSVDLVLGLAGVVPGRGDPGDNIALGVAAVRLGARFGARRVFVASSAAVYGVSPGPLREAGPLAPAQPYGQAKRAMEQETARLGMELSMPVTALRIGNVAGADALLAQDGPARALDRFADGQGPRRSYIGPQALARILAALMMRACQPAPFPDCLNVALAGAVDMADLCAAAGFGVTWRPAPPEALDVVELDVARLASLVLVPKGCAVDIVRDWREDCRIAR
jgi:nucleoside-diphosphate-sugar epimerase